MPVGKICQCSSANKVCPSCRRPAKEIIKGLCRTCYHKEYYSDIHILGDATGEHIQVKKEDKELFKEFVQLQKDKVYKDAAKHPRKYLGE